MADESRDAGLLGEIQTLFGLGVVRGLTDGQLLERFLTADDVTAERAFTSLMERHGPMVLHVCRSVLDEPQDAQDAFQATFLIFLRRASSIRKRESVASWLFGVARRVSRRARYASVVRRFHERQGGALAARRRAGETDVADRRTALHEEIARLPDRFREPVVLCHLEGLSTAAAAHRLGCPHGTILSRLARGRNRLRRQLGRRGLIVPAWLLAANLVPQEATAAFSAVPAYSAVRILAGRAALATAVSPAVTALTQSTLRTLLMTRVKIAAAILMTATALSAASIPLVRPIFGARADDALFRQESQTREERPHSDVRAMVPAPDLEESFYQRLRRDHELNDPRWPYSIKVRDLQDRTLIDLTLKHRIAGKDNEFDLVIQAGHAVCHFDLRAKVVRVLLDDAKVQHFREVPDVVLINDRVLEFPIPADTRFMSGQASSPSHPQPVMVRKESMGESHQALSLTYSPDGKMLASAGFDGLIYLWDMARKKEVGTLAGEPSTIVRSLAFSPDSKTVAIVNDTGFVKLCDVSTGKLLKRFHGLSESMRRSDRRLLLDAVAFSPDGRRLAVSGIAPYDHHKPSERDYELRVFDLQSREPIWSHMGHGDQAFSLSFSPDGKIVACGGWRTAKLWDAATGEPIRTLYPTQGTIRAVAFTPDGLTLVGGGTLLTKNPGERVGHVTLWDDQNGRILNSLEGHRGGVHAVAVAPDGKMVASGGQGPWRDNVATPSEIRLWEVATGELLLMIEGELGFVRSLAFAPDGKSLVYCDDRVMGLIDIQTDPVEHRPKKTVPTPRP